MLTSECSYKTGKLKALDMQIVRGTFARYLPIPSETGLVPPRSTALYWQSLLNELPRGGGGGGGNMSTARSQGYLCRFLAPLLNC